MCPSLKLAVGLALPCVNIEGMKLHLDAVSKAIPEGRHALMGVDGAGWHQERLNLPNITLLRLPPYSPELNPCEQVWRYLKDRCLSNRCYKHYDAILDAIWACRINHFSTSTTQTRSAIFDYFAKHSDFLLEK